MMCGAPVSQIYKETIKGIERCAYESITYSF